MFDIKTPERADLKDIDLSKNCAVYAIERSYKDDSTDIVINNEAVEHGVVFVILPHGCDITRII